MFFVIFFVLYNLENALAYIFIICSQNPLVAGNLWILDFILQIKNHSYNEIKLLPEPT